MGKMPWLRLYTEARRDRKLDLLTDKEHRIWFNLLLYSAEDEPRGVFEINKKTAIEVCRGNVSRLESAIETLVDLGLCEREEDRCSFPAFFERQYLAGSYESEAPENVAARKRESRAREFLRDNGVTPP